MRRTRSSARRAFSGASASHALEQYGLLSGMVLPILLFPAAFPAAVGTLLQARGNLRTAELPARTFCSARQLERQFTAWMGCPPKTLAGLIRYQCLWRDLLTAPDWNVQDAVALYGFADQSHLLRSFKRYHGMTPARALAAARGAESVAFLQSHIPGSGI